MTVIDPREEVLGFADKEVSQALCYSMRKNGARFLLGEKVSAARCPSPPNLSIPRRLVLVPVEMNRLLGLRLSNLARRLSMAPRARSEV